MFRTILTAASLSGFVVGSPMAFAEAGDACEPREVSVYFERGASDLTQHAAMIVERLAADASTCGAPMLTIEAPRDALGERRARAIDVALASHDVDATVTAPMLQTIGHGRESVLDRVVTVRVTPKDDRVG